MPRFRIAIFGLCLMGAALVSVLANAQESGTPVFQGGIDSGGAGSILQESDSLQIPDVIIINAICYFIYDDFPACVFQKFAQCDYIICLAFDPDLDPEDDPEVPDFPVAP